jgi:hypothetical protein
VVAVWSGSFARKSRLLAAIGVTRKPKRNKRKKHKGKFKRVQWAKSKKAKAARRTEKAPRRNWQVAYQARNHHLKTIGFDCYSNYLVSELWKSIREKVLRRDAHTCYGCRGFAFQVHHKEYTVAVLKGTNLTPLVSVCRDCHQKIEFDHKGNKISLQATNAALEAIRSRCRHTAPRRANGQAVAG